MKIVTIVGARPQFIKAAMVSRAIREYNRVQGKGSKVKGDSSKPLTLNHSPLTIDEVIVHTGQHYDYAMSQSFFDQMDIPEPKYHLDVAAVKRGNEVNDRSPLTTHHSPLTLHGDQTGRMLAAIEKVLIEEKPGAVLIYGDTNSTLAGSLAAAKLHIPVGHVEGGMRSFNRRMPEEINRVLTDHIATWHFCATETALDNLKNEGVTEGVHLVGDVMHDAVMLYKDIAAEKSTILQDLGLAEQVSTSNSILTCCSFALCTVHRAENTDDPERLRNIVEALVEISKQMPVVLPLHPRTRKAIDNAGLNDLLMNSGSRFTVHGLRVTDPLPYLDILRLEQSASVILTDSGGMQKEAFWLGVPCITMRDETEWVETVEVGANQIVGASYDRIIAACTECRAFDAVDEKNAFASNVIVQMLSEWSES